MPHEAPLARAACSTSQGWRKWRAEDCGNSLRDLPGRGAAAAPHPGRRETSKVPGARGVRQCLPPPPACVTLPQLSGTGTSSASTARTVRRPSSTPAAVRRSSTSSNRKERQMDTNPVGYWDAQARNYDDNIFSTIDEDTTGIIKEVIETYSNTEADGPFARCVDLGCGAGKYLLALSTRFGTVTAYDLSPKLVALARKDLARRGLENVTVSVRDLTQIWYRDASTSSSEMGSYGFAVMANVLIAPISDAERGIMLRNAFRSLCPGGRVMVVVPSLESALYVNMRCEQVSCEGPYRSVGLVEKEVLRKPSRAEGADLLHGVLKRSGVRTKHFLQAEFDLLATRTGFLVERCEKVTYSWHSELGISSAAMVPAGLREGPPPWDWLFLLLRDPEGVPKPDMPCHLP